MSSSVDSGINKGGCDFAAANIREILLPALFVWLWFAYKWGDATFGASANKLFCRQMKESAVTGEARRSGLVFKVREIGNAVKLQQYPEYSNTEAVSTKRLQESPWKGNKNSRTPARDLWVLNCCCDVVTPALIDFTHFFCQILCKLRGRGRPSSRQRAEQMCRRCGASSVTTNQWSLLWRANECGSALITWRTHALSAARARPVAVWLWTGTPREARGGDRSFIRSLSGFSGWLG